MEKNRPCISDYKTNSVIGDIPPYTHPYIPELHGDRKPVPVPTCVLNTPFSDSSAVAIRLTAIPAVLIDVPALKPGGEYVEHVRMAYGLGKTFAWQHAHVGNPQPHVAVTVEDSPFETAKVTVRLNAWEPSPPCRIVVAVWVLG